jgi:hypothetical protein
VSIDGPKSPGDGDGAREITFWSREGVGGGSAFQEEQCQEDKDLGPDTSMVCERIDTKGLECGEDNEDGGPAMVEREGQVDKDLVTP